MNVGDFEPEILQDFLTESNALLETLQQDLVDLGSFAAEPELLNRCFRALHTIKGNASFLGLTNPVEIAHAAESALDAARDGSARIGPGEIGLIRDGVGVLAVQLAELRAGRATLTRADPALVARLAAIRDTAATNPDPSPAPGPDADAETAPMHTGPENTHTPSAHTVRVEVDRLAEVDALVREVAEWSEAARRIAGGTGGPANADLLGATVAELGRATDRLRLAATRTRLQPVEHLFQRYTRLISDLGARTGKRIRLETDGGSTEVDRRVVDLLGGPLIHLLRNCADHGIEPPAERSAAGKPEVGTVRLTARYAGSSLRIRIIDDGRGLDRGRIGRKAVERGQCTESELGSMSDDEVYRFIFGAGFSTVEQVSELSGRGVGMDVVRNNIEQTLNGDITVESVPGRGTTMTITVPLTEAIVPVLTVQAGGQRLLIPSEHVIGIDGPGTSHAPSRRADGSPERTGAPVVSVSAGSVFTGSNAHPDEPFAVQLTHEGQRVTLRVSAVDGFEDVVVRPTAGPPGSHPLEAGLIRDDGGPGRMVDVAALMRLSNPQTARRAA
tara:strand:+ start:11636 stop:13312 length:1677 start_codon:yes stop_codon:yes gene_type:complete